MGKNCINSVYKEVAELARARNFLLLTYVLRPMWLVYPKNIEIFLTDNPKANNSFIFSIF